MRKIPKYFVQVPLIFLGEYIVDDLLGISDVYINIFVWMVSESLSMSDNRQNEAQNDM